MKARLSAGSPRYMIFQCNDREVRLKTESGEDEAELLESDDFVRRVAYSVSGGPYGMALDLRPFVRVSDAETRTDVPLCDEQWAMLRKCNTKHLPGSKRRGKK